MKTLDFLKYFTVLLCSMVAINTYAVPSLQLGPDETDTTGWTYVESTEDLDNDDVTDDTWVFNGDTAVLNAYALDPNNASNSPWDAAGLTDKLAYLVVSSVPGTDPGAVDVFDIDISLGGNALTLVDSGYGTPPPVDTNALAPHGIFPTWFEVYQFSFNDVDDTSDADGVVYLDRLPDTALPVGDTTGQGGWAASLDISVASLNEDVSTVHFDLFTAGGDGSYIAAIYDGAGDCTNCDQDYLNAFAPFSHDAEFAGIPEPSVLSLLALGLLALPLIGRRQRRVQWNSASGLA